MNLTVNAHKYQAFRFNSFTLDKNVENNVVGVLSSLPDSVQAVFNYLMSVQNNYVHAFPSIVTISRKTDFSTSAVSKAIRRLKDLGMINTYARYDKSSIRQINRFFFEPEVRARLSSFLYAFKYHYLDSLATYTKRVIERVKCNLNNKEFYLKNNYIYKGALKSPRVKQSTAEKPDFSKFLAALQANRQEQYVQFPKKGEKVKQPPREKLSLPSTERECLLYIKRYVPLTLYGSIVLSAFPLKALRHVLQRLERNAEKGYPTDPFTYAFKNAERFCREHKFAIDYEGCRRKAQENGMPAEASYAYDRQRREDDVKIDAYWQIKEETGNEPGN